MRPTMRRGAVRLAPPVAVLLLAAWAVPPPASAADPPPPPHVFAPPDDSALPPGRDPGDPPPGRHPGDPSAAAVGGYCGPPAANPVPDDVDIVVSLPPAPPFTVGEIPAAAWKKPALQDPTWQLTYYGFRYLPPLAARAAADGSTGSLSTMVAQVAAFHTQNPDVGANAFGWDEGTALRRLEVLNCLYSLTQDQRLVTPMRSNVAVQFSRRYYGPPLYSVHNHGLMANLAVVGAADLLHNATWRANALKRIRAEAPLAFTRLGTSWEQSSMYQRMNQRLWDEAADTLAENDPADPTVAAIRAVTRRAGTVYDWFTEPDGRIVQLGDAERQEGGSTPTVGRLFRDDQAGVAVGRWHPTDPAAIYYTLRYGPRRTAHGHEERTGVTFTGSGVRVLVNPGYFTYDKASPYNAWQSSPAAANTAVPAGRRLNTRAAVSVAAATIQARAHAWRMRDALYDLPHTRTFSVNTPARRLIVADTYPAGTLLRQHWHLDAGWEPVSGSAPNSRKMVFRHPAGPTLTVTTTGLLSSIQRGATRPVAGWLFPKRLSRVPAPHLVIRATATLTTTFVIS